MKKNYLSYIIPSIIVSVFGGIYVIVDGIFIGQVVGDDGLSAINIAWPITAFLQALGLAIGIAIGICISQYEGKKDFDKMKKAEGNGIILLLLIGAIISVVLLLTYPYLLQVLVADSKELYQYTLDYTRIIIFGAVFQMLGMGLSPILRNKGRVKLAMTAMLMGTAVNVIGDYVFIYLLDLGLEGAAITSVLGMAVSGMICLIAIISVKGQRDYRLSKEIVSKILKIAFSPFILNYSASILIIVTNFVCLHYGGSECVATYTIYSYIIYVFQSTSQGCGDGVQPLMSYYYGTSDYQQILKTRKKTLLFSLCIFMIMIILIIVFKDEIPILFGGSPVTVEIYQNGFLYYISGLAFIGIAKINCCFLYAVLETKKANIIVLLEPLLTPVFLFTLPLIMRINGIWLSYSLAQFLILIIGLSFIIKSDKDNFKIMKIG